MSTSEISIIIEKLESIERRLDLIMVPVIAEELRQLKTASPSQLKAHNAEVRRRARSKMINR